MKIIQVWNSIVLLLLISLIGETLSKPNKKQPASAVKAVKAVSAGVEPASGMKVVIGEVISKDEEDAEASALKAVDDDLSKMMDERNDDDPKNRDTDEAFVEKVKEEDKEEKSEDAKDTEEKAEVKAADSKEVVADHTDHPVMLDAPQEDEEAEKAFKRSKMNNYRANMAYVCPTGRSFSTVLSSFYPSYRDRSWSGQCDRYLPKGYVGPRFWTTNYGYDNEYRGTLNAFCPPQSIMSGMAARWHSSYYDRRYKLYCTHIWHHRKTSCKWSPYMNNWRESAHFTLSCNDQYYMAGMQGYFHSSYYDRRFRIYMCKLQKI